MPSVGWAFDPWHVNPEACEESQSMAPYPHPLRFLAALGMTV